MPPTSAPEAEQQVERFKRRSYLARILLDVVGRPSAVLGLVWIGIMAFLAVFGPLLATSHALIARTAEGRLISPAIINLEPVDVSLIFGTLGTVALFLCRYRPRFLILTLIWGGAVAAAFCSANAQIDRLFMGYTTALIAIVLIFGAAALFASTARRPTALALVLLPALAAFFVQPPIQSLTNYRESRAAVLSGDYNWAVFAPVPFSPQDRFRDVAEDKRFQAPGTRFTLAMPDAARADARENPAPSRRSWVHLMGTDSNGQDLASRLIHGSRIALSIGFIATGIAVSIGIVIGALMGFFSGWVDLLGMRLVEIFAAIPVIFLLILVAAVYDRNIYLMMVIIGLTGWVGYAVFIRAEFLKLRQMDFVQAAIACGVPLHLVLMRHMLPNGVTPVLVSASFGVAAAILTESTLSYIGLGLPPGEPSWGGALREAVTAGEVIWWIALFPGAMIFLTVLGYNLVGESLRDAIDPRTTRAA
ncbi:MAG: ABC transporter permease [Phycisphaeraceae bacterium]|nr:ABC transporter permease [Phycisphaeraceae bacterium]